VLGVLAMVMWSSGEFTERMDRSLGRLWPRAVGTLYRGPNCSPGTGWLVLSPRAAGCAGRMVYAVTVTG
jgi:hypothetical protein